MINLVLYLLLLVLCLLAVGLNVLSLPGNWIMLALAVMWGWWEAWPSPLKWMLGIMLLVLLMAEGIELLGSVVGAKKFGASTIGSWAAIGGAIVGAILGTWIPVPVIGNIVGAILGAFVATWLVELIQEKPMHLAVKAALGAALGRGVGMVVKIGCGLVVWLCLAIAGWPGL